MEVEERRGFTDLVTSEAELRELVGEPSELVIRKQMDALDGHCRAFIALSPFVLIASADAVGNCDVSPRGDAPGFVLVLDDRTLVIPERPGNRRADTLFNILQTGAVGLLFMIPGVEETLRVNGRAQVVRDPDILERTAARGKPPKLAISVTVEECFLHCGKAIRRSGLWDAGQMVDRSALPPLARMLLDQARPPDTTLADLECRIEESYTKRLY